MNKHLIEFLIALKNASLLKKPYFLFPISKQIVKISKCLYKEGFIQSYACINSFILITIRGFFNKQVLKKLRILSTPSKTRYLRFQALIKCPSRKFVIFLSTSRGLLTLNQCKKFKIGGKALFVC